MYFVRAYNGTIGANGQTITTSTQKTGTGFRFTTADANAQTFSNNLTGTVSWEDGGTTFTRNGTLVCRFTSGSDLEAIAFDSTDGDLMLVLSGSYTTSTFYNGNSGNLGASMDAWVAATEPSAASSTISANPTSITADGVTTSTVTVTVKLSDGTAISGASVVLSQTSGVTSTISGSTTTSATGVATFTVSSTVAGTGTYQATAQNGGSQTIITSTVTITYVPGPVSLAVSTITASPTSITANGTATSTITVQLKDAQGNNRTSSGGTVVLSPTLGSIGTVTDNSNGTYTATLTAGTVSGTSVISGTLGGNALTDTENITFVAGAANRLAFVSQPTSVAAGASISPAVTVEVQDSNGNRVTTATDSITLAISTNPGSGTLSGTATVSAASGLATFSGLSINKTGTGYTLSATSGSLTGASSSSFNVTPGSASTAQTTITASPSSLLANGSSTSTVTVQLKDSNGNNLTSAAGTVVLNTTLGTLGPVNDNGNGTYTATLTAGVTGGTASITGSLGGASLSNSASVVLTDASLSTSTISASPSSITADGTSTSTITVQLKDSSGNNLSTSGGIVTLNTTLGSLGSVTDNSNGTYTATLTAGTTSGTASITGSLGGNALIDDASVSFVAGPATKLGFVSQPTAVVAGANISPSVTVELQDANGNRVTSATDSITLAIGTNPGSGTLSGTATVSAVSGLATFSGLSINTTGTGYTLSASATSLTGGTSSTFNVTPGTATQLVITTQPVGGASGSALGTQPVVAIRDSNGNTVTSDSTTAITVAIQSGSGGSLGGILTVTASSGVATFGGVTMTGLTGQNYVLRFTSSPSLTSADSAAVTLSAPASWNSWAASWSITPTATGNPDDDLYDNVIEYAFRLDPTQGSGSAYQMTSSSVPGASDLVFIRGSSSGSTDTTFAIESTQSLGPSTSWNTTLLNPSFLQIVSNGDGTETVRIIDIQTVTGLTSGSGFVRLKASVDTDGNPSSPDSVSYTEVAGWYLTSAGVGTQTEASRSFGNPFLEEAAFTGTVNAVSGQQLTLTTSAATLDLSTLLTGGHSYYIEVMTGSYSGNRFDVTSGSVGSLTLALDTDLYSGSAPFNTLLGVPPAGLVGALIVLRRHQTIESVFPPTAFTATANPATASSLQTYAGGAWQTYWLYTSGSTTHWVLLGDSGLTDRDSTVVPAGQGSFLQSRTAVSNLLLYGKVRSNKFVLPMAVGINLVRGGFPLTQSPADRAMTTADNGYTGNRDFKYADQILLWNGDASPGVTTYQTYFLVQAPPSQSSFLPRWARMADSTVQSRNNESLFNADGSAVIRVLNALPTNTMPLPWNP